MKEIKSYSQDALLQKIRQVREVELAAKSVSSTPQSLPIPSPITIIIYKTEMNYRF